MIVNVHDDDQIEAGIECLQEIDSFDNILKEELVFTESGRKTDLDLVGINERAQEDDEAFLMEIKSSFNNLDRGFNSLEKGITYLEEQGYQVEGRILVLNDQMLEYRELLDDFNKVYSRDQLFNEWDGKDAYIYNAIDAGVSNDLDPLVEETRKPIGMMPKYDWETLEEIGWVEETGQGYTGTELLEEAVENSGENNEILHTGKRIEYMTHPRDYI